MKRWLLLIALLTPAAVQAQSAYPNFNQGSMTSTTTTNMTINETVNIERYGGEYSSWSGSNVQPSGSITDPTTSYSVVNPGEQYQLEITTRAAGIIETEQVVRTVLQDTVTTSLSVFSQ